MIAKDLINPIIPSLSISDDIARASSLMDDLHVPMLPVLEESHFRGFIHEDSLYDDLFDKPTLGAYPLVTNNCTVYQDQHFYEVVKVASECQNGLVAVLETEDIFLGIITAEDIVQGFAKTIAVQSPGSIIEVSLKQIDYSLAEITRLIESENTKVVGCFLSNDPDDNSVVSVTFKLDKKNISHVIATLKRFNYQIVRVIQEESIVSYEKERLDALMKYLSI